MNKDNSQIVLKGIEVKYSNKIAISDINIEIEEGDFVGIVGPNGAGKTSIIKVLSGLIKPSAGEVKVFGEELHKAPSDWVAYVPQIKKMDMEFPAKTIDLVISGFQKKWPVSISKAEKILAEEVLEMIGASNLIDRQLNTLSGGELQRTYLARALIRKPRLLLLDEPSTGIDLVCETNMEHLIEDYNKEHKATVVMVTHDWTSAYHHTQKVLLVNHKQIFFGSSKEAFSDENLQHAFSHQGNKHNVKFQLK